MISFAPVTVMAMNIVFGLSLLLLPHVFIPQLSRVSSAATGQPREATLQAPRRGHTHFAIRKVAATNLQFFIELALQSAIVVIVLNAPLCRWMAVGLVRDLCEGIEACRARCLLDA